MTKAEVREQKWIAAYREAGAYWAYSGDPRDYHARLTGDDHSNGYFNSQPLLKDDTLMREAATELIGMLADEGLSLTIIDGVVGPQTGATKLAKFLSEEITKRTGKPCFFVSPSKHVEGGVKTMILTVEERALVNGKNLLCCDDVFTTGGSAAMAIHAVTEASGFVLPWMVGLVNRSGFGTLKNKRLFVLITMRIENWKPDACLLCKAGSPFVKPKEKPENWAILTACAAQPKKEETRS